MSSEDIRNRPWTEAEKQALRDASEAQAAGRQVPAEEYETVGRDLGQTRSARVRASCSYEDRHSKSVVVVSRIASWQRISCWRGELPAGIE